MLKRNVFEILWDTIVGIIAFIMLTVIGLGIWIIAQHDVRTANASIDYTISLLGGYIFVIGFIIFGIYSFYFIAIRGGQEINSYRKLKRTK